VILDYAALAPVALPQRFRAHRLSMEKVTAPKENKRRTAVGGMYRPEEVEKNTAIVNTKGKPNAPR